MVLGTQEAVQQEAVSRLPMRTMRFCRQAGLTCSHFLSTGAMGGAARPLSRLGSLSVTQLSSWPTFSGVAGKRADHRISDPSLPLEDGQEEKERLALVLLVYC